MKYVMILALFASSQVKGEDSARPSHDSKSDGSLICVLNKYEDSLAIVDPVTKKVLGKIPTGHIPHEVAVSADGKLAFTTNYGTAEKPGHTISVLDLVAKKPLRTIELGAVQRPHGIFLAENKIYFTAENSKLIGRYDPANDRIDWLMGTGQDKTHMISLSKDAKTIFTSNILSNTISIFERTKVGNDWTQIVIPVGKGPEGHDLSPDGKQLWAANSKDGTVSIIDIATRKLAQTIDVHTEQSNRIKFTPDSGHVLISDLRKGDLVVIDVKTQKVEKRLHLGRSLEGILIPQAGSHAYVAATEDNFVAIIDLATLKQIGRLETGKGPDGMVWIEGK
jgi:YVTN family beta-propeller protein